MMNHVHAAAHRSEGGFTLIELMIAVAIIAIVAAIAYPSYQQHIIRGKRSAAQAQMMYLVERQQQFLLANRGYADKDTLVANGYLLPAEVSESYTWDVALGGGPVPSFTITFTGTGVQAKDNTPGPLTLDGQGNRSPLAKWQR